MPHNFHRRGYILHGLRITVNLYWQLCAANSPDTRTSQHSLPIAARPRRYHSVNRTLVAGFRFTSQRRTVTTVRFPVSRNTHLPETFAYFATSRFIYTLPLLQMPIPLTRVLRSIRSQSRPGRAATIPCCCIALCAGKLRASCCQIFI